MEARVRPALHSDKEPLMSFIKDVWGGHDYIPQVWEKWLRNPDGEMFVVEVDGKPVGMNRVRFLADGSAWFEGARVHPDYRGRGLGSMLGENSMRFARERGVRLFRLTSGSHNRPAHRQIAKIGFKEAARFSVYEPSRAPKPTAGAKRAGKRELEEILSLMENTKEFNLGTGVAWHDFTACMLNHDVVRSLIGTGAVWWLREAIAVVQEGDEGLDLWEEISFLGGPVDDARALMKSLLGRNKRAKERWVFVPQGSPLIRMLRSDGYVRNFSMILFERRAAND